MANLKAYFLAALSAVAFIMFKIIGIKNQKIEDLEKETEFLEMEKKANDYIDEQERKAEAIEQQKKTEYNDTEWSDQI